MAEPASGAAAAASPPQPADPPSQGTDAGALDARNAMRISPETAPSGFQAVNAQATSENASAGASTAASPARGAVVPPDASSDHQPSDTSKNDKSDQQISESESNLLADAATYGTRSRNQRTARPNYAEDQDMDFEFAASTTKKKGTNDATGAGSNATDARRPHDASRFTAVNNSGHANGSATKESTPGTPGATSNLGKKRKAAVAAAGFALTPEPSPAPSALRKAAAPASALRETNVMTFTKHKSCLNKKGELIADDGTKLCVNDHVYLVCEPPGDPYYLCRIMEFLHAKSGDPTSPVDSVRVNWYYRPRDVQRFNNDSRLLYGTMHSDMCPIASLRGKCEIKHRSEIEDLEAYRKERDSFYFVQVFDRFIHRWYECIPVSQIINVPEKVKKALDERWKFVIVEIGRVKELTSDVKTCKRCTKYCASQDSVDCAICKNSYHMNCVQPPLPKKPSRGFAWACGPCSRASEKKLEARNTPNISGDVTEVEEEEFAEGELPSASNDTTRAPSPSASDMAIDEPPATEAEIAMQQAWPMRYLGIHCRLEDALQYDDRAIYPRASSRLGPRHQANVTQWPGRPVELVKPIDIKKRYNKATAHKEKIKLAKETQAALEADREERAKRPKWVQDEPPGYISRGEDYPASDPRNTAKLIFKMPEITEQSETPAETRVQTTNVQNEVDDYLKRAKMLAKGIGVPPFGCNFLDKALELLSDNNYDQEAALEQLKKVHRIHDLHEPVLSKHDLIKFEEGVAKYGSEHRLVRLHMKTSLPNSDIIRFYYLWKKTPKGREIWGNFGGRKGSKRKVDDTGAAVQQSVANDADDSAFDNEKALKRNRGFQCKFCDTTHSRQWRKAPGVAPGQTVAVDHKSKEAKDNKTKAPLLALCLRCAGLWRKYAIQWEDVEEISKKVAQGGMKAWKRRIDEELLREVMAANDAANATPAADAALPSIETNGGPPHKKLKTDGTLAATKKAIPPPKEPTPPPPPIVPTQPQWRILPCAVCLVPGDTVSCTHCKLTVHRQCFGLDEHEGVRSDGEVKWICEQCSNDRNPQVSTEYACCLCLTEETPTELVELPKSTHKKKNDRDKEKAQMEKELADAMRTDYRNKQIALNRPEQPREPLKRTTGNNWVHVYCAVWMPEIRFSNAKALEVAEGFQNIPLAKLEAVCKLCKNKDHSNRSRYDKGACVSCFQCHANIHVSCAMEAGYIFGFDVTPVKGSRKDQITTVTLADETGSVTAGIWCKDHVQTTKSVIHPMNEVADASGRTAMQVYVENYKQADLTLTGTIRKANLAQLAKDKGQQAPPPTINGSRRESTTNNSIAAAVRRGARTSSVADNKFDTRSEGEDGATQVSDAGDGQPERRCAKCSIDVTPKWHLIEDSSIRDDVPSAQSPQRRPSVSVNYDHAQQQRQNAPNIRFMPPGASGRAWDGMPDRYGPRPLVNGERDPQMPLNEGPSGIVNGEMRDAGFPPPPPPPHYSVGAQAPPLETVMQVDEPKEKYLCHKCFLKKKLDPTPPPEERKPAPFSPRRQPPLGPGWNGPNQPPAQPGYEQPRPPIRMPWDDAPQPPPHKQQAPPPPPPPANGLGLSMPYGAPHPQAPPPPPHHSQPYPPYGQPTSGYPQPPPHHQPHPPPGPPHAMHERNNSYGYAPPPPPTQLHYQQHGPPPPHASANIYPPPPNSHVPNGLTSPRAPPSYPPLQSPPRQHAPPYQGFGPGRTESPFATSHLPPYDPRTQAGNRYSEPNPPPPPGPHQNAQQHIGGHMQSQTSPHLSGHTRVGSQGGPPLPPPPAQHRDSQAPAAGPGASNSTTGPSSQSQPTPTPAPAGASASPSLRNLLS